MSLNIECEDRVMLSEEQYHEILTSYLRNHDDPHFIVQTNTYIDTLDFKLKSNHKMLRVRNIQGFASEFTLKIKGENGDKEYNEILPYDIEKALLEQKIFPQGEITSLLVSFGINLKDLKIITTLKTVRFEEQVEDFLVVIDKNQYSDITDYNLEIEAPTKKRAHDVMMALCKKFNIEYSENYSSKSKRAIQAVFK